MRMEKFEQERSRGLSLTMINTTVMILWSSNLDRHTPLKDCTRLEKHIGSCIRRKWIHSSTSLIPLAAIDVWSVHMISHGYCHLLVFFFLFLFLGTNAIYMLVANIVGFALKFSIFPLKGFFCDVFQILKYLSFISLS